MEHQTSVGKQRNREREGGREIKKKKIYIYIYRGRERKGDPEREGEGERGTQAWTSPDMHGNLNVRGFASSRAIADEMPHKTASRRG